MLWFLHLCSVHGITVMEYRDNATGVMEEDKKGSGRFTTVTLHPQVIITDSDMVQKANSLHKEANTMCFIANSCNFKIEHEPITGVKV